MPLADQADRAFGAQRSSGGRVGSVGLSGGWWAALRAALGRLRRPMGGIAPLVQCFVNG